MVGKTKEKKRKWEGKKRKESDLPTDCLILLVTIRKTLILSLLLKTYQLIDYMSELV